MRPLLMALLILVAAPYLRAVPTSLTGRDAGLYVGVAGEYMFGPTPFAFSLDQANLKSDPAHLRRVVERLHANGKRSLLDIYLYEKGDEPARPAAEYMTQLDRLLSQLPLDKLYAITLAEENIYWFGHAEMLAELYHLVKAKYPNLQVYQWYSPGASAPGFGWPLLPADGWVIDEYCKPRAQFENLVKKYVLLDKPLIHIAWAAPDWPEFQGWDEVWDDQLEICRRYGVPISFFCWWPPDSKPPPPGNQSTWSWSAPPGTEHHRVWNQQVLPYVQRLRQGLPAGDPDQSLGQAIPVAGDEHGQYTYREDFRTSPRLVDDADIEGFTRLRWTGERLELKSPGQASLTYRFESPFVLHDIQATARGVGKLGTVSLGVSADGKQWVTPQRPAASLKATLPALPGDNRRRFWVRVALASTASALEELTITARVDPPAAPQVKLVPGAEGKVAFTDGFRSQLYLHAGRVTHPAEVKWSPGGLRMYGKQGQVNEATVDYHFICDQPLTQVQARLTCAADKVNFGSTVALALSADGQDFPAPVTTDGVKTPFRGELVAGPWSAPGGSREFWVRVRLLNTCGAATTQASPTVQQLVVTGQVAGR